MRPLPYVWPYAAFFWPVCLWAFLPEFAVIGRSRGAAPSERKDAGSLQVILIGNWIGLGSGFAVAFYRPAAFTDALRPWLFALGLAMVVAGGLLRRHCFRVLGEYFTGDVRVRANQPVIQTGAYAYVRHPSYTGGMLMFGGMGLTIGSWLSFVLVFVSVALVYTYRVHVEERALAESIGEPYREYMRTHKRFVPGIF